VRRSVFYIVERWKFLFSSLRTEKKLPTSSCIRCTIIVWYIIVAKQDNIKQLWRTYFHWIVLSHQQKGTGLSQNRTFISVDDSAAYSSYNPPRDSKTYSDLFIRNETRDIKLARIKLLVLRIIIIIIIIL